MSEIKENLKMLCKERKITFAKIEKELGYGNGSLAKAESISAQRLYEIAKHLDVSMESIVDPTNKSEENGEKAALEMKNAMLKEKVMLLQKINSCYEEIGRLKDKVIEIDKALDEGENNG